MWVTKNFISAIPVALTFPLVDLRWADARASQLRNVAYQGFSGGDGVSYVVTELVAGWQ